MRIAFVGFGEVAAAFSAALGADITAYDVVPRKPKAPCLADALRGAQDFFARSSRLGLRPAASMDEVVRHFA